MTHKEELDLDLEDIIREFSDQPDPDEFIREFKPKKQKKPAGNLSGDTIRLQPLPSSKKPAQSRPAPPPPPPKPAKPVIEPFSEEWEPEYEDPMGQYTPKSPIRFPSQKLRSLREKLANGPEKRYYELAQMGFARLKLSIFACLAIFILSAGITYAYLEGYLPAGQIRLVVFCQLMAVLLSALIVHGRLVQGLASLTRGRFTLSGFLLVTALVCLADALLCLSQKRVSCCSIFCLEATMAQWAIFHDRRAEMDRMDTLRKASELIAVAKTEDYDEGAPGYSMKEGQPESFLDHCHASSGPEKGIHAYAALATLASAVLAVIVLLRSGWGYAMYTFAAGLMVSLPATVFISMRRPEALLEKRLHSLGTVLCGWQGIKAVERDGVFPICHWELFPKGSVKLNGMKFYGSVDPDMVLCYAGSLVCHEGGSLCTVFRSLMAGRYIRHARVEEFCSYPGGLSALVDGEPVAVGTLEFMKQLGIEVPKNAQIRHAVYAAVDGNLSGVFAVCYSRSKAAAAGLRNICGYPRLRPTLVTPDFMISHRFLQEILRVNAKHLLLPDPVTCSRMRSKEPAEDATVVALLTKEGFPQRTFAVTGARAICSAQKMGALIHVLGGSLGLAAVTLLALIGAWHLITPVNLLAYCLLWMIPGWLITEWTRYV